MENIYLYILNIISKLGQRAIQKGNYRLCMKGLNNNKKKNFKKMYRLHQKQYEDESLQH